MVSINHLTVDFTGEPLFDDISFLINPKEKIALVGKNGAGKTTLLKVLAGLQPSSKGDVAMPKDYKIGYLPQHLLVNDEVTLMQEVKKVFANIAELEQKIEQITQQLADRYDYESEQYHTLIDKLSTLNERLEMMDINNMAANIEKTLIGLGFKRTDFDRQTAEFSGGWRMRIELAKILLSKPDLLLLDEPTNHLDIESITWLEQFLQNSPSSLVLVSHDRAFLDAVTTRTIEISLGQIFDYKANYSKYVELRAERRAMLQRAYDNQQKMIADTEEFIERFRYKATKAVQVQSRIKQLEKLERIELDIEDKSALRLKFPPAPHCGALPVDVVGYSKSYGYNLVLQNIDLQIKRGEKVAFVGRNGEGKTTLVRSILSQIEYDGKIVLAQGVKIGYFAQNQASLLDDEQTVFETIDRVAVGDIRLKIRQLLGQFMFDSNAIDRQVKYLSGGERSRLAMIKLLLEPSNLLILDEPTNHLDMRSKDVLKQAIKSFDGTVIVVSHDRDFLDGLVDRVYEFKEKKIRVHDGGINEYLALKKLEEEQVPQNQQVQQAEKQVSTQKNNYEQRKEQQRALNRIENQIAKTEQLIAQLESEIAKQEELFAAGDSSEEAYQKYGHNKHLLEQKMYEWELMEEQAQEIRDSLS